MDLPSEMGIGSPPNTSKNLLKSKVFLLLATLAILHLVGVLGVYLGFGSLVLPLTPVHLLLSAILCVLGFDLDKKGIERLFLFFFLAFGIGMGAEILGVQKGWIFGSYDYGTVMGPKLLGVPLTIGLNWFMLSITSASISANFQTNLWIRVCLSVFLMVCLDAIMEPTAIALGFWRWADGVIPIENFIGWAFVALVLQVIYHFLCKKMYFQTANAHYVIQLLFFLSLLYYSLN